MIRSGHNGTFILARIGRPVVAVAVLRNALSPESASAPDRNSRLDVALLLSGASRPDESSRLGGSGKAAGAMRDARPGLPRACAPKPPAWAARIHVGLSVLEDVQARDLPHGREHGWGHCWRHGSPDALLSCERRLRSCEKLLRTQYSCATWPRRSASRRPRYPRAQPAQKRSIRSAASRSLRRIQSNFSVAPFAPNSEYPRRCAFVR